MPHYHGRRDAPVRVLIVDDDALVRAGLTMMLGGIEDIVVVGEASDGDAGPRSDRCACP